jgi:hypothetical protein
MDRWKKKLSKSANEPFLEDNVCRNDCIEVVSELSIGRGHLASSERTSSNR